MSMRLEEALRECLSGWRDDLDMCWRDVLGGADLAFDAIGRDLSIEPWEPIFPVRRGRIFPGMPAGTHMFRAFDGIAPHEVRCVILGQDPYPSPCFSTGRAFEAGNVATWRELDKMFSKSVRAFIQLICAARTGNDAYAGSFDSWPATLAAIESGEIDLEAPEELAGRWVRQGVLLLNSSLTLTRFRVDVDAHQSHGHLPMWRPFVVAILAALATRGTPIVFLGFGDAAAQTLQAAGIAEGVGGNIACILRRHPAEADRVLPLANPFALCNRHLKAAGATPVAW
jgi:uracil-DNA glycosylase